jgi:hypothetical protein
MKKFGLLVHIFVNTFRLFRLAFLLFNMHEAEINVQNAPQILAENE